MAQIEKQQLVLDCIFYEVPTLTILQGAYMKIAAGSVCVLFGKNGSGKSTLIKVAAGQLASDSGIVIINGKRFYKKANNNRYKYLAYLPQDSMLPDDMNVKGMLKAFRSPAALYEDKIIGLNLEQKIGSLSGGQRRYLEIALLLSLDRPYVLLDEPFTGIEPLLIEEISKLIIQASDAGTGFLITDHYYQYMIDIADDAYLMMNKQCRHLNGKETLKVQLEALGYMHQKNS